MPQDRSLVVLGYPNIAEAADIVPLVGSEPPAADLRGPGRPCSSRWNARSTWPAHALDKLPEGSGWLMVQFGGDTKEEARTGRRR